MLKALLWDVDGTLAETERDGHLVAFNAAFEALGLPWRWSERHYAELLRVAGGFERLQHFLASVDPPPREAWLPDNRAALARRIHQRKNELYVARVAAGVVTLRPGVRELIDECTQARVAMAVVTTTSRGNVEALLRATLGPHALGRFATIVGAEDAPRKKPDPEAYALALERLAITPREAVAIEDSPAGVDAARAAGIPVILARSCFFEDADGRGTVAAGPGLHTTEGWVPAPDATTLSKRIGLQQIRAWHARFEGPA